MKNPVVCKSECGTWYVIVEDDNNEDCHVVFEGMRKKDCVLWLKNNLET